MSDSVHLLVPFASCGAPGCGDTLRTLALPHFDRLLARLRPAQRLTGQAHALSMPHERVLARAYGLADTDGLIPWAAWQVEQAGRDTYYDGWAWITPCHWRVGRDNIVMDHPELLQLDGRESLALLQAMQPYFEQDGIRLEYDAPTRWLARGEVFRKLPSASLDRVIGRRVEPWLPAGDAGRPLRRLQQEMQMLLYTLPLNDERTRGGLLPVNSFWISGTGALPSGRDAATPRAVPMVHALRDAALRADWPAWAAAWQQLDARDGARLLAALDKVDTVRLTLCGEHHAQAFESTPASPWLRLQRLWRRERTAQWLQDL